jgi:hypothetical protein
MTDLERVIRLYEDATKCPCDTYAEIILKALYAYRARECPQPLTLEQLQERDGKPEWIVSLDESFESRWNLSGANYGEKFIFSDYTYLRISNYGKTWIAYDYPPKDKDAK